MAEVKFPGEWHGSKQIEECEKPENTEDSCPDFVYDKYNESAIKESHSQDWLNQCIADLKEKIKELKKIFKYTRSDHVKSAIQDVDDKINIAKQRLKALKKI